MPDDQGSPIYVAIIGTDTLLTARPVDWVQLTRACQLAGFDFVAPVSWGEELIAMHLGERMSGSGIGNGESGITGGSAMVAMSCPFVGEALRGNPAVTPVAKTVSPPVACARYLRAAFRPRPVHVTYVGACPGAVHPEVDQEYLPEVLFARMAEAGIDLSALPHHLDAQLPVERARYASLPGGAPNPDWLMARAGARLVEAAPITVDAVAQAFKGEAMLIDLAPGCRCVCARDRFRAAQLEPPRSSGPVVKVGVAVTDEVAPKPQPETPLPAAERDRKASFAENGLSAGEVVQVQAPELPPSALTRALEPW
jgi:hypothetical protein